MAKFAFQNVIDTASHLTKQTGFSLGVALPNQTFRLASGHKDKFGSIKLLPNDPVGIGSATKTMTAAAVLKLVDNGLVNLEDMALPHMDTLIHKVTGKSLQDYVGPQIKNVTVRHLLHMTSGLGDFDAKINRMNLYQHPDVEIDMDKIFGVQMQNAAAERHA